MNADPSTEEESGSSESDDSSDGWFPEKRIIAISSGAGFFGDVLSNLVSTFLFDLAATVSDILRGATDLGDLRSVLLNPVWLIALLLYVGFYSRQANEVLGGRKSVFTRYRRPFILGLVAALLIGILLSPFTPSLFATVLLATTGGSLLYPQFSLLSLLPALVGMVVTIIFYHYSE